MKFPHLLLAAALCTTLDAAAAPITFKITGNVTSVSYHANNTTDKTPGKFVATFVFDPAPPAHVDAWTDAGGDRWYSVSYNGCYGRVEGVCAFTSSDFIPVSSASVSTPTISDDIFPVSSEGEIHTGFGKSTHYTEGYPTVQRLILNARYRQGQDDTVNGVMTRYQLDREFLVNLEGWNTGLFDTVNPLGHINVAAADRQRSFSFTHVERSDVCDVGTGYCDFAMAPASFSLSGQVTKVEVFAEGLPAEIPEPSSLALVALGLAAAAARRKRS